jgi:uncharacterized membrane protein
LLAPLLLQPPGDPSGALFPYLGAVNVGVVIVGRRAGWAGLPLASFAGSAILLAAWCEDHYELARRLPFLGVSLWIWLLYAVTPLLAPPRPSSQREAFWSVARGTVVLVNGLLMSLVVWALLAPDLSMLRGIALAVLALVYVFGARVASRLAEPGPGVELSRVAGVAIAAIAIPVQFDQAWVTFGWTVLAGVLFWSDLRLAGPTYRLLAMGALLLAAGKTALIDPPEAMRRVDSIPALTNGGFLAGIGVVALLVVLSVVYRRRAAAAGAAGSPSGGAAGARSTEETLGTVFLVGALVLLLWKITFETALFFAAREASLARDQGKAASLAVSLLWAAYALAVTAGGFASRMAAVRTLGIVLAGLLVAKVFLLDLQTLAGGHRIASFVGAGILMLAVSLLYQRRRGAP